MQHTVVLGKTGAGKSTALRHLVEYLLVGGKRVCVIDPKGDWWGLKMGRDGRSPGFPVIGFGDFKDSRATDIPLNMASGKVVAELIAHGNRPALIGFRGWMPGATTRFWIDFASTLFNTNAGELYLVIDECHNFAAKGKIMDPAAGQCLHWTNRLMSEGRGNGIVCLIASQRPQKVHNDTLTCCETLITMKAIHKSDRLATKDWIDGCGDGESGTDILNTLAKLNRGEAWVWSPGIDFGPERINFPMFTTFDSFAPPQLQPKVATSGWADVDLDEVKQRLAAVIEETEANNPKVLRARIAELQAAQKAPLQVSVQQPVEVVREVPVLGVDSARQLNDAEARLTALAATGAHFQSQLDDLRKLVMEIREGAQKVALMAIPENQHGNIQRIPKSFSAEQPPTQARQASRPEVSNGSHSNLGGGRRRMLIALAQYPEGMDTRRLSLITGIKSTSGTWSTYLGELRGSGYVVGGAQHLRITPDGVRVLGHFDPLPRGEDLINFWKNRLGQSGMRRIFDLVVSMYPRAVSYETVAKMTNISQSSGTWSTYLGKLRGLGLVEGKGELKASDDLFK